MRKNSLIVGIVLFFSFIFTSQAQEITPGAERLDMYEHMLKGKKVGIVANHTSRIEDQHLVDSLLNRGITISYVFSPEHGFRGIEDAGAHIENTIDEKTNLPVISLYGSSKKPHEKYFSDIDIMIFDIQDVGVRFYTYISTLHYVMEACSENNTPLIVLDRPNPNGFYVDGPVLNPEHSSFVGMHPIPIVHGLTVGELAQMINGEKWIEKPCDIEIIPCNNYSHKDLYDLPLRPSPNLPNMQAIYLYPSLGLFEGTIMSVGRGTDRPFQVYGHPNYVDKNYSFMPLPTEGASMPKYTGTVCYGVDFQSLITNNANIHGLRIDYLKDAYLKTQSSEEPFFKSFFTLLAGNNELQKQIEAGSSVNEIKQSWQKELTQYKETRKKYLLYDDFE
ncbi:MAG: DUF1343 domain-containing protein [Salinivirgaceae bacterium]|nr:DUF1343 domain-containing protein [Salinivirgaceae bacterium]